MCIMLDPKHSGPVLCGLYLCALIISTHQNNLIFMDKFTDQQNVDETTTHSDSAGVLPLSARKTRIAKRNLESAYHQRKEHFASGNKMLADFSPGEKVKPFQLQTLNGRLDYPSAIVNETTPILMHVFNEHSGFLQCLWNCSGSVHDLVTNSPNNTHYIFLSQSESAYEDAVWMFYRFNETIQSLISHNRISGSRAKIISRLHFVTTPVYELGNWLAAVPKAWACQDHNCGLDQVALYTDRKGTTGEKVVMRLDARYDWLPSPTSVFGSKVVPLLYIAPDEGSGCKPTTRAKNVTVIVESGGCSYFTKVQTMEKSGALGVLVLAPPGIGLQDMNCEGSIECDVPLGIPASMVPHATWYSELSPEAAARFQNTPADNFFLGINSSGHLAEVGWFLYPTFHFLAWQAQWFNYQAKLKERLSQEALAIPVFDSVKMQGHPGAVANVTLPALQVLQKYEKFELDTALSCPGTLDKTCPHWDHTVQLFVCCDNMSPLCGMELGRWISPFRRRIGHWLTDVTALLPLLTTAKCTFMMQTVPWAMEWMPSLNLRFSQPRDGGSAVPVQVHKLYDYSSVTFDKHYNSHFLPFNFTVPSGVTKVAIVAVITGHGSDENGCGEFCITSHHFVVNKHKNVRTFDRAGSPLGCAEQVPYGVEPNEHGTWLYGRDGWCDGQEVDPWVIDITAQLSGSAENTIKYYGWFQGKDPDPKQNPGIMAIYSYLVFYKSSDVLHM